MKKRSRLRNWLTAGSLSLVSIISLGCASDINITGVEWKAQPFRTKTEKGRIRERSVGSEHVYHLIPKQVQNTLEIRVNQDINEIIEREQAVIKKQTLYEYRVGTEKIRDYIFFVIGEVSYKEMTGKTKYRIIGTSYELIETKRIPVSENIPAGSIPVQFLSTNLRFEGDLSRIIKNTNNQGEITVRLYENFPFWSFTKEKLRKELEQDLAEQVTPEYLDSFVEDVIKYAKDGKHTYSIVIETLAELYQGYLISLLYILGWIG